MQDFVDDDAGYLDWLRTHPAGYVLNARRAPGPGYLVLHRARCPHISRETAPEGNWTTGTYRKICSDDLDALRDAARRNGRLDGSFWKTCAHCAG